MGVDPPVSCLRGPAPRRLLALRSRIGSGAERKMLVATLSIPATLAVAGAKTVLLLAAPSAFLIVTVVYAVGAAAAKGVAVQAHRSGRADTEAEAAHRALRAYRVVAVLITALSALFVLSCLPLLLGGERSEHYDPAVAVIIATISFVELVMAVCGAVAAKRDGALLVEAVRLTSLAAAFVLLVLTQTALMSFAHDGDASRYNGLSGVVLGSCAALIGVYMLIRSRLLARRMPAPR